MIQSCLCFTLHHVIIEYNTIFLILEIDHSDPVCLVIIVKLTFLAYK